MAKGICEVCGKQAVNKKKVKPRFCSRTCRSIGYTHSDQVRAKISASHKGKKFADSHKENHLEAVRKSSQRCEYREKMSAAKKGMPLPIDGKNGAGTNNKNAKYWWFIKDGKHYRFKSLNKFVRDNKHLFTADELTEYKTEKRLAPIYRATVMLRNLHIVKKNGQPLVPSFTWHGWTIGEKWAEQEMQKALKQD